jgi:hypothetical protein
MAVSTESTRCRTTGSVLEITWAELRLSACLLLTAFFHLTSPLSAHSDCSLCPPAGDSVGEEDGEGEGEGGCSEEAGDGLRLPDSERCGGSVLLRKDTDVACSGTKEEEEGGDMEEEAADAECVMR